jgi:transposase
MLGDREPPVPLWSYRVNLEKRVRSDHRLRRFNQVLDLSFVRSEVAHTYGRRGNKSVPPETIMRMMLLLFLEEVRSERELMRIIPERLDYMWFLGYGLDQEIPNHSVLSKARKRWGQEVFVKLFSRVVQQCVEAGLVEAKKLHIDATLVDANASLGSVKAIDPQMRAAIERTAREQAGKLAELEEPASDRSKSGTDQSQGPGQSGLSKTNLRFQSKSDPDATLTRRQGLCSRPRYKSHRVVDDAHEIITAVETTTGAVDGAVLLMELVKAHEQTTGTEAHIVIADSRSGSVHNLIEC